MQRGATAMMNVPWQGKIGMIHFSNIHSFLSLRFCILVLLQFSKNQMGNRVMNDWHEGNAAGESPARKPVFYLV